MPLCMLLADLSLLHSEAFLGTVGQGSTQVSPLLFTEVSETRSPTSAVLCSYVFVCLHGYVHVCSHVSFGCS